MTKKVRNALGHLHANWPISLRVLGSYRAA